MDGMRCEGQPVCKKNEEALASTVYIKFTTALKDHFLCE